MTTRTSGPSGSSNSSNSSGSVRAGENTGLLLAGALSLVGGLVLVVWRHWILAPTVAVVGWLTLSGYGRDVAVAAGSLVVLLVMWRVLHPDSFSLHVVGRVRSRWRGYWVYLRHWTSTLAAHGLVVTRGQQAPLVPGIGRPRCDATSDLVPVRLRPGQSPGDFAAAADRLAHAFGALSCRVLVRGPGRIVLVFTRRDTLAAPVPALPIRARSELRSVAVGVRDDGQLWRVPLLGAHLLVSGASGAGKGSVVWSLLRGIAGDIASGRVAVWGLDPKGGMELAPGRALFTRFCDSSAEDMAALLEDAVRVMDARTQRLKGLTRLHTPTVADPLLLVVVDELASLTAYVSDRATKTRIAAALGLLLSKGRAAGVLVIGAVQDPRKETLPLRDLFTVRVALRLPDKELVDLVLGNGARSRGALADTIPLGAPGVGYVVLDGDPDPVRVRAGHVTDTDLAAMAATYAAPPSMLVVPARPEPSPAGDEPASRTRKPRLRDAS